MTLSLWLIQILFVPMVSPLGIGCIKKIKARFQNRQGASVFQPYQDLWKLFHKDEIISTDASWIFRLAPFAVFTVTIVIGASIPLFTNFSTGFGASDMLFIIYTLAIGTFFLALAGIDTGGAFGGFGSSREMTLAALAEGGLMFSLLTVALIAGTGDVFGIAQHIALLQDRFFLPVLLGFVAFCIIALAEAARFPFDNPAPHLELTMIHEAMILEYSGKRLALMEWASANKLFIFAALGMNLFFPWGLASQADGAALLLGGAIFLAKTGLFYLGVAVIESSIAKLRFFRLPDLLATAFILDVIAIGLTHYL